MLMLIYFFMSELIFSIYHIPTRTTVKSLSTCFLTFHTLSSSFQGTLSPLTSLFLPATILILKTISAHPYIYQFHADMGPLEQEQKQEQENEEEEEDMGTVERKMTKGGIALSPFGLATYKMQGTVWISNENGEEDQERLVSMVSAADSWLKQLRVQHHDFTYFTGIQHA